jgi:5-methylcytosine-specific restriction enzyme subunit McrC
VICVNRYVNEEKRKRSFTYLEYIPEVDAPRLTKDFFLKIYFGRHNVHYKRMVHIARLLHELRSFLINLETGVYSLLN